MLTTKNISRLAPFLLLFGFFLDSFINAFYPIPIGASTVLLVSVIFLLYAFPTLRFLPIADAISVLVAALLFILVFLKSILYGKFLLSDLSDLAFFSIFLLMPIFLKKAVYYKEEKSSKLFILFFLIFVFFLISPSFFGLEFYEASVNSNLGSESRDLEHIRGYHQGFYRHPHIASYFFSFLAVFAFFNISINNKKILYACLLLLSIFIVLFTGSRSGIYSIIFSAIFTFAFFYKSKVIGLFLGLIGITVFIFLFKNMSIFEGTVLYQYFTFFITITENFERLSRVIIWRSWLASIEGFNVIQLFFGKLFSTSFEVNKRNTGSEIWFHNDWLSVIYSYGILGFIGLVSSYFSLYLWLVSIFKNKFYSVFILTMLLFLSLVNGMYYYYPMIFLYLINCSAFYLLRLKNGKY